MARDPNRHYFHDACLEEEGQRYTYPVATARQQQSRANDWHGPADPSSWLAVAIFCDVRRHYPKAQTSILLALAGQSLGISPEKLRGAIEWHEQYMRWHDGDPDYKVL